MTQIKPTGELRQRQPRIKDALYLHVIRLLPCVICMDDTTVEAAHVRAASPKHGKRACGGGERPDDAFALPLCGKHHREQHGTNEMIWWSQQGIDPHQLCLDLWEADFHDQREDVVRAYNLQWINYGMSK